MLIPGIIGGVGPETSTKLNLKIINKVQSVTGKRPEVIVWNFPMSLKTERDLLVDSKISSSLGWELAKIAKKLELAGADFIVLPSNTLHLFANDIQNAVSIPLIDIVSETGGLLKNRGVNKAGLIATPATIKCDLFSKILSKHGISTVTTSTRNQKILGEVINRIVSQESTLQDEAFVRQVAADLVKNGANVIVLACTDLQNIFPLKEMGAPVLDTFEILAESCVRKMLESPHGQS